MLQNGVAGLLATIKQNAKSRDEQQDDGETTDMRNALKMYCFLLSSLLAFIGKAEKRESTTSKKKKSEDQGNTKESIVAALVEVVECHDTFHLWSLSKPEETYGQLFFKTAASMFELPNNVKSKVCFLFLFSKYSHTFLGPFVFHPSVPFGNFHLSSTLSPLILKFFSRLTISSFCILFPTGPS